MPAQEDNSAIWRYIDFADLVAMLEYRGLFFANPFFFDDPYEGCLNLGSRRALSELMCGPAWTDVRRRFELREPADACPAKMRELLIRLKRVTYVNCWHINDSESVAMWRLYSAHHLGLALRSRTDVLRGELAQHQIRVLPVRYIDYESDATEMLPETIYFYKRRAFEHERELRAFFMRPEELEQLETHRRNGLRPPGGCWIPADLDLLIQEIVLAPTTEPWFKELVERVLRRYGLQKPIKESGLTDAPLATR